MRESKILWMVTLKFVSFAKIRETAKYNNRKILSTFYGLFHISQLFYARKEPSFRYTLFLILLLDQLHLISLKLYYFCMSCYQLYFKYFLLRKFCKRNFRWSKCSQNLRGKPSWIDKPKNFVKSTYRYTVIERNLCDKFWHTGL